MSEQVTIPAYAADTLHETMTLDAPAEWHKRIRALTARTCYGPRWSRAAVSHLLDMSAMVRNGYSDAAYDHLLAAERAR